MKLIDVSLSDENVDRDCFSVIKDNNAHLFLGVKIKNLYDQERLIISEKFSPRQIICPFDSEEGMKEGYFRGFEIEKNKEIEPFFEQLKRFTENGCSLKDYNQLLFQYHLSCSENYGYFEAGIFPLNTECLNIVSTTDLDVELLYKEVFSDSDIPYWQHLGYLSLFILINKFTK